MNLINLNSFFKFGYFLNYNYQDYSVDFSRTNKFKYENVNKNQLIDIGINFWNNAINNQFVANKKHVVPLSDGLDRRAILCSLLKTKTICNHQNKKVKVS